MPRPFVFALAAVAAFALLAVVAPLASAAPSLENAFVSSRGWVKPGESYPFTLRVRNDGATPLTGARVTLTEPDGTTLGTLTWDIGTVAPGAVVQKVVEARADTLAQDPEIAWKDLSATAELTYAGGSASATSHGPKVIPPTGGFETARYGDRPFPVVPVDFSDRHHAATSSAERLAGKINDPDNPGSTFNLYQEMSYGQLFPHGTVPSDGIATEGWTTRRTTSRGGRCSGPTSRARARPRRTPASRCSRAWGRTTSTPRRRSSTRA